MPDTVDSRYVYPPNYDTSSPPSVGGARRYTVHLTNVSDGTGEAAVKKVDISTLRMPDGSTPTSVAIEKIEYDINGMSNVQLYWDHTTDILIAVLAGERTVCWKKQGGLIDDGTGDTGDILLTTVNAAIGGFYDITITMRPKA